MISIMQGLPAAFANEAFGKFLDLKHSAPITADACGAVLRLINVLSQSYIDTSTAEFQQAIAKALRPDLQGMEMEMEPEGSMMEGVCSVLYFYFREVMSAPHAFRTLRPSWLSMVGVDQHISVCVYSTAVCLSFSA